MFEVMFMLVFFMVLGVFVGKIISGLIQWNKNNNSPRLVVDVSVVAKRTSVSHHHHGDHGMTTFTSYFVTFQFTSGDRMEFDVNASEYGMLVEGDRGKLSFQGTRYLGFERV